MDRTDRRIRCPVAAVRPMTVPRAQAMAGALEHYRAGRIAEAVALWQAVLADDAGDAEALHLLGVAADAQGDPARGAELIRRALALEDRPQFHANLGMVLGHLNEHQAALAHLRQALAARPDYPEALNNFGVSLQALHRLAEAEATYRQAAAARPGWADPLANLGATLQALGRPDEAVAAFQAAVDANPAARQASLGRAMWAAGRRDEAEAAFREELRRHPDDPDALNDLAVALGETGRHSEAASLLPRAVRLRPGFVDAQANLGQVLVQLGRLGEAVDACQDALATRPDHTTALATLGTALRGLARLAESEAVLRRLVALRPAEADGYNNLAITLQAQDRPHEALAVLDLAAALHPDDPETHHHRAMILLRQGRLAEGWALYDWRFRIKQAGDDHAQFTGQPAWQGGGLEGRTILLVPEQGLGDSIQFARYAALVARRGGRVVMGVQKPLARLFAGLAGVDRLVATGDTLPPYDVHCALLSLPRVFGTTLDSVPGQAAYLHAEPALAASWSARLAGPGLRVGLVWAGNPTHLNDRERSVPVDLLAPLLALPGVSLDRARLMQIDPFVWSIRQMSDDTPPVNGSPVALDPCNSPIRCRIARMSSVRACCMCQTLAHSIPACRSACFLF